MWNNHDGHHSGGLLAFLADIGLIMKAANLFITKLNLLCCVTALDVKEQLRLGSE